MPINLFECSASNGFIEQIKSLNWTETVTVVVAGVGIVLAVLIVLILVFNGFGKLVSSMEKRAKNRAAKKAEKKAGTQQESPSQAPTFSAAGKPSAPVTPAPAVESGISPETVAVITAAIAAGEGSERFVIRSVKRKDAPGRNPWARAAIAENTRSF